MARGCPGLAYRGFGRGEIARRFSLMPIYEFFCPDNHKIYSFFARNLAYSAAKPRCPDDPRFRMERMISSFSVTGRAKEEGPETVADDPAMERAMAEMEREFSAMDSDSPDPRQLAQMMRKLSAISGESMPEPMEEMMRRLEGGENIEKLEEEFGDVTEGMDAPSGGEDAMLRSGDLQKLKERLRVARQQPVRDPVMYEMAEYAELPASPVAAKRRGSRKSPR
jgi:hypothetical protein